METKTFSSLYAIKLTVADLYSLCKSTLDYARPVKDSMGALLQAGFTQLEADTTALGVPLNKAAKSGLTPLLSEKDTERDHRFAEVKRNITTACKGLDANKKAAAESLKIFFEPYWKTDKKAMNTETVVFAEMIEKYRADENLVAMATTVGIADMLTGLETANTEFAELYKTRNTQKAAQEGPSATSLKPAVVKSYEQFCATVEQTINLVPADTLNTLFMQMDELRKNYARMIGKKDNGDDTPAEPEAE